MCDKAMDQKTKITPQIIQKHGLSDEEYKKIEGLLGRTPNITELGIFSVMWSEHCSYKSSKIHLKRLPTTGKQVIQGPGENAGIVDIGGNQALAFKMESHNHPSFIEPYQGAATGVGGILRDIFTMGARPIANMNSLRFGDINADRMKYLVSGVVAGVGGYGNSYGCPTVGGDVYFDECYNGNILVNAFNAGLIDKDKIFLGQASGVGNPVIYVGSKTGRDGIHGATMASDEFNEETEEKRPTVQVGDPFTENILTEACLELMQTDAISGIQDMGAAGLTCSAFEMASRAGTGIEMDLDKVPQRAEGMTPYEMMLSESQERMLMVAHKGKEQIVFDIFKKWGLDCEIVGVVTDTGRMVVRWHGEVVVDLPVDPISAAAPVYERPIQKPSWHDENKKLNINDIKEPDDLNNTLKSLLSALNIASKEWVYRQYDQYVLANTAIFPGSDAAVVRIKDTKKAVGLVVDCNSRYCYLDPYRGAALAVAECARNLACVGAKGLAITDCMNFGNPEKPEIMWQFKECVDGMTEACNEFDTPVTGGNVSFYNETKGQAIYPTPTIGMVGLISDLDKRATSNFKDDGDVIILLGNNTDEIGGSEYLKVIHKKIKGKPPYLDFNKEKIVQKTCIDGIKAGFIKSAHDCSDGGIAITLAESCIMDKKNPIGATIQLDDSIRSDCLLFGEGSSRIVVSVAADGVDAILKLAEVNGCVANVIGAVGGKLFTINDLICLNIDEIHDLWWNSLPNVMK
ncbi:phosphoribosylformylglycinamidine synthase subunit PurL [bacterium]|nr:phosphoribosylformylglycinamidine synthase subunit PurL [bacterium]